MARVTDKVNPLKRKAKPVDNRLINYIALVVDTSGSMSHLTSKLNESIREQVSAIKQNAHASGQETYVSVYLFNNYTHRIVNCAYPEAVHVPTVRCDGGTALMDAVGEAITDFKGSKFANESRTSFLVITLTDGEENSSKRVTRSEFERMIRDCQATDRWSFAFMTPPGGRHALRNWGVPDGNVTEWDGYTEQSMDRVVAQASLGTQSYYLARSAGETRTESFFPDLSNVKLKDLKKLDNLSDKFRRLKVGKETDISSFCSEKLGKYEIGRAYYQLTKSEKIQDHKKLVIEDKKDKKLYGGDEARNLIGIASGPGVTVRVSPGNHANFNIFVNSTSMNRKLVRGTDLLYERS